MQIEGFWKSVKNLLEKSTGKLNLERQKPFTKETKQLGLLGVEIGEHFVSLAYWLLLCY